MADGFSVSGLDRLRRTMTGFVDAGVYPGIVFAIHRHDLTQTVSIGSQGFGMSRPMAADTIFRVASMTKLVVAVAAMALVEDGRLRLDVPVETWLPELADRRVLRDPSGPVEDTVAAERAITVRDVLTGTMGFGQLYGPPGSFPILDEAERRGIRLFPPMPLTDLEPDEWIRQLGELPLMYQPGERWLYNAPGQVLGVLVARAAGQPLDRVLRERILDPLGMTDTAFSVPAGGLDRLAAVYDFDQTSGDLTPIDGEGGASTWASAPVFPDGAGGLVATTGDMLTFGRMMLGGGRVDGVRILSRPTVLAMTVDQLTASQKTDAMVLGDPDARGWGLGLSVITRRDQGPSTPGKFGWDGGYGTSLYIDPAEDLVGVMMTQRSFGWPDPGFRDAFWTALYAAIDD